ncbi:MAG: MFS transporter [Gammaproteobacteria bacterium]|nr:MFS transporter [Gammaproteobacteria bacterium]
MRYETRVGGTYAKYVLFVMTIVYVFNFIDRQILSILAEPIKADLGLSDADLGFLYGTAFAVFYAVFGIPLGRLADTWHRVRLVSIGLSFWSLMTALSGFSRNFVQLALCRFGVGIGEASASPATFSMLSDYFSPRVRAIVIAIYSGGLYIGAGIGIFLGGAITDTWNAAYPDPMLAPLGLRGWQAAFLAVGMPGILLAFWVWTLREPVRGMSEGLEPPPARNPVTETLGELRRVMPLVSAIPNGSRALLINFIAGVVINVAVWLLYLVTGDIVQWVAMGIGVWAFFSWAQGLLAQDPASFALILRSRAMIYTVIGFPMMSFVTYGVGFWGPAYMVRTFDISLTDAGRWLGLGAAIGGFIGITLGGWLGDTLRARTRKGRMYVGYIAVALMIPCAVVFAYTNNVVVAYVASFFFSIASPLWVAIPPATVNDLVLPRMRALASAFYIVMPTFLGLALGPYMMGFVSDQLVQSGLSDAESLRLSMLSGLLVLVPGIVLIYFASQHLEADEDSRIERARAAGEVVEMAEG